MKTSHSSKQVVVIVFKLTWSLLIRSIVYLLCQHVTWSNCGPVINQLTLVTLAYTTGRGTGSVIFTSHFSPNNHLLPFISVSHLLACFAFSTPPIFTIPSILIFFQQCSHMPLSLLLFPCIKWVPSSLSLFSFLFEPVRYFDLLPIHFCHFTDNHQPPFRIIHSLLLLLSWSFKFITAIFTASWSRLSIPFRNHRLT